MSEQLKQKGVEKQTVISGELLRYMGMVSLLQNYEQTDTVLNKHITTELAESLDTFFTNSLDPYILYVQGDHILSENGEDLTASAERWAFITLDRIAAGNTNLQFLADMACAEVEEMYQMVDFSKTGTNGAVVYKVSTMPNASRDVLKQEGFFPDLKRSFIRQYIKTPQGLQVVTASFDNAVLADWNDIFNINTRSESELLSINLYATDKNGFDSLDAVRQAFDTLKLKKTGIQHRYGRPVLSGNSIDALAFVNRHRKIVEEVKKQLLIIPRTLSVEEYNDRINTIFYNAKASLKNKYELYVGGGNDQDYDVNVVTGMLRSDGMAAAAQNITFGGCSGNSSIQIEATNAESQAAFSYSQSFTRPILPKSAENIALIVTECPFCCQKVTAPYDTKSRQWLSCGNKKCAAYSQGAFSLLHDSSHSSKVKSVNTNSIGPNTRGAKNSNPDYQTASFVIDELQSQRWQLQFNLERATQESDKQRIRAKIANLYQRQQLGLWATAQKKPEEYVLHLLQAA